MDWLPPFAVMGIHQGLPENGDANGAYNIARKGICILERINKAENTNKVDLLIRKNEWQDYAQN